jgi:hypothetical protein
MLMVKNDTYLPSTGTQKHKEETTVYLGSGYRGHMSSSEVFLFRSTQIRGLKHRGEKEFGRGSLGAIYSLSVVNLFPASKGLVLSLTGLPGEELACVPLSFLCLADASDF